MTKTPQWEMRIAKGLRQRLPIWLADGILFGIKMVWCSVFGILILLAIMVTRAIWQDSWALERYDALLAYALILQILFLKFKLESWDEARAILLFHLTGMVMEVFKVYAGSWAYPEPGIMKIGGVPLFSGFMYASVGSFMARAIRLYDMKFAPYPPFWTTMVLAILIYLNFFSHHYTVDIRYGLFAATVILFWGTRAWFSVGGNRYWMPLTLAAFFSSFALWVAENIGTMGNIWKYTGQGEWEMVRLAKMGSWYLLLYVAFVTVTIVCRDVLLHKSAPDHDTDNQHHNDQ